MAPVDDMISHILHIFTEATTYLTWPAFQPTSLIFCLDMIDSFVKVAE